MRACSDGCSHAERRDCVHQRQLSGKRPCSVSFARECNNTRERGVLSARTVDARYDQSAEERFHNRSIGFTLKRRFMKTPSTTRRFFRRTSLNREAGTFKKEGRHDEAFFGGTHNDPFFRPRQPAVQPKASTHSSPANRVQSVHIVNSAKETVQRQADPLPNFSQGDFDSCGAASVVAAIMIQDRQASTGGVPNNSGFLAAANIVLSYYSMHQSEVIAALEARRRLSHERATDTAIITHPSLAGLAPGQVAQIGWYVRVGATGVNMHAFLIGRLNNGTWYLYDQGPSPPVRFTATSLAQLDAQIRTRQLQEPTGCLQALRPNSGSALSVDGQASIFWETWAACRERQRIYSRRAPVSVKWTPVFSPSGAISPSAPSIANTTTSRQLRRRQRHSPAAAEQLSKCLPEGSCSTQPIL